MGGDGVTTTAAAKLDATTPKWPVVEANLADPPTVTVGGVTTEVTGDDPQRQIVALAAAQARGNGRPIRARVTTPGGQVHRLIVTPTGRVARLDQPTTLGTPGGAGKPTRRRRPGPSRWRRKRPGKTERGTPRSGWAFGRGRLRRVLARFPWPVRWTARVRRVLARFPRPVRWAALVLGVLTVAALVVGVLMTVAHLLAIVASRRLR